MKLRYALPIAVLGGHLLDVASPSTSFWPASFIGMAFIFASLWGQRARSGLLIGASAGAAFWGPHIFWLTLYLGPVPWLGLVGAMVFWFALMGAGVGFVTSAGVGRLGFLESFRRPSGAARPSQDRENPTALPPLGPEPNAHPQRGNIWVVGVVGQALAVAGLWVLREQVQGAVPYGGFAWGRLAHMQADGPLAQAVSWTGFAGLSGLVALIAALPIAAWFARNRLQEQVSSDTPFRRPRTWRVAGFAGVSAAMVLILAVVPAFGLEQSGSVTVGAVQGNSNSGIFDDRDSGDVLGAHVEATEQMLDDLESTEGAVDVIVWPENSAELDLPTNALAKQRIAKLSQRADAPVVVGTVIAEDGKYTNSSLVWGPEGVEPGRYDKRYPVPFAEYMPHRAFYRMLAPDLVDLVQLEYEHGTLSPVVKIDTAAGRIAAGLAICFDIIFDAQGAAMVNDGAQVIFAQTNNADFGRTDESAQQLSIARLRAVETGRALVNISTVGTSAIVAPNGADIASLPTHTAGAMVAQVPLVEGETPALRFGAWFAWLWVLCAALGVLTRFLGARAGS